MDSLKEIAISTPTLIVLLWAAFLIGCVMAFVWVWLKAGSAENDELEVLRSNLAAAEKLREAFEARDLIQQAEIDRLKKTLLTHQ